MLRNAFDRNELVRHAIAKGDRARLVQKERVHVARCFHRATGGGMRGIGVEEAAAIGAELLDRLLTGDRTYGERLLAPSRVVASIEP
jgi:hypothetical protein